MTCSSIQFSSTKVFPAPNHQPPHSPLHRPIIHPPTLDMNSSPRISSPSLEDTSPRKLTPGSSQRTVAPLTMSCVPAVLDVSQPYMKGKRAPRRPSISHGRCLLYMKRIDPSGRIFGKLTLHATITGILLLQP